MERLQCQLAALWAEPGSLDAQIPMEPFPLSLHSRGAANLQEFGSSLGSQSAAEVLHAERAGGGTKWRRVNFSNHKFSLP